MRLFTKRMAEDGNGRYQAIIAINRAEIKALDRLVKAELARQRREGKNNEWQTLKNCAKILQPTQKLLQINHHKRVEGRYLKMLSIAGNSEAPINQSSED